jgi:NitT/TauT family transport system permease protein
VTTLAADTENAAVATRKMSWAATWWPRLRPLLLAVAFPAAMLAIWHFATVGRPGSLIPPPYEVWLELWDLAFGGINDDAYSNTLHIHLLASISRVYGGFALALIVALPLGMLIGRVPLVRQLLDPTIQILRPVPVTAWLPLAMIIFGLGPRSAFFLVFLGAFYPILVNTIFGVRSVEPRLFEAASMLGCSESAQFFRVVLPAAGDDHHGGAPALAYGNRDFRDDRHRRIRVPVRPAGDADRAAASGVESIAWLRHRSRFWK